MKVYYCGREDCLPGHSFGPAVRQHFLIHFVLDGQGIYRAGGVEYQVRAGECFLIWPGAITYYEADELKPWSYGWAALGGKEAEALLEEYGMGQYQLIGRMKPGGRVRELLEQMVERFDCSRYEERELLGYFYLIISCLKKKETGEPESYESRYLEKAVGFIRDNYSYPISIVDVAKYVGVDRTYLYRIFMQQKAVSPKQYLMDYRISAAREMLLDTDYRITEIALSCGFHDSSAFCRSFAGKEHMSPMNYRRSKRGKVYENFPAGLEDALADVAQIIK